MSGKEKRLIDANIEVIEQATTVYPMEELHYPSAEEGPETITLTVDTLPGPMVSDGKGGYVVL